MRGCARGATVERSETGERTMIAPAGQSTARACLRSKLAALVVRRQAGPATWGLHAPKTPNKEVGRPTGYANAVLLFALNACGPSSVLKFGSSLEPPQGEQQRCRGGIYAARNPAITTPFILCIVGRGLDPSAGRRGRRPLQHNPQGFSLPQTSAAACGQAALHPTLPHSVGRAFARNSFTPPCRGRACPARSLAITTPYPLHRRAASYRAFA